jgi:hypothetical protein
MSNNVPENKFKIETLILAQNNDKLTDLPEFGSAPKGS